MPDTNKAHLLLMVIEFMIPESHSLKDKRQTVASIIGRVRHKYNASVAEIACLDKWQHGVIGISMVGNERSVMDKSATAIENLMRQYTEIELSDISREWI